MTPRLRTGTAIRFLVLAAIWGSSFTLVKVALGGGTPGVTPAQLVLFRLVLGAAVLTAIAMLRGGSLRFGTTVWGHLTIAGLLGNVVPFLLLSYGELHTSAGLAGVLVGSTPLLTAGLAVAALPGERTSAHQVVGLLVGLVGIAILVDPWSAADGSSIGPLSCLGAAASYAGGFVYVRRFISGRRRSALDLSAGQLIAASGIQAATMPLLGWSATPSGSGLTPSVVLSVVVLGVVGTGLAYLLYFRLIEEIGATGAASVDYLVPVFSVLVGVAALGEPLTTHLLVGGIVVLLGVAAADVPLLRAPRAGSRDAARTHGARARRIPAPGE